MKPSIHSALVPVREPAHKRVPFEVWEQILSYIYPSQLSRISMVNKKFNSIVSSMEVWFRIFAIAHGPKAHLRPLVGIPKSKCYMMFMCASSLHVCEKCFGLAGYNADSLYKLPLPIPILLPRRPTNAITYLGERLDPNWTIRMCLSCRQDHILNFEEPFPRLAEKDELERSELYQKYPCTLLVPELRHLPYVNEITAVKHMRRHFGGNVGVKAYQGSTEEYDEKTGTRIRWYQLQE